MAAIDEIGRQKPNELEAGPVYDNFYSPENCLFYTQNPYKTLSSHDHEIRLLRLLSSDSDGMLSFTLLDNVPLASVSGTFTALSYCAGNPRNTTRILVNGQHFNAFANLGFALQEILIYWGKKEMILDEQLLWVDQVCINQSDSRERSHQVDLMRDIYAGAERVVVCLCQEKRIGSGLKWMKEVRNKLRKSLSPRKVGSESQFEQALGGFVLSPFDSKWTEEWLPELTDLSWLASSPWWKRCWICQEFTVARRAEFLYGGNSMNWEDFAIVLCSFLQTPHAYGSIFLEGDQIDFSKMQSLIARKIEWNQAGGQRAGELKSWLDHGLTCESSDLRDKVFAFLGLASDAYNITPDYYSSTTVSEMLIEIATRIIAVDKNLDILLYKDRTMSGVGDSKVPGLPSWVPDWTNQLRRTWSMPVHAKSFSSRVPTVEDSTRLMAEGFNLDDLKSSIRMFLRPPPEKRKFRFGRDNGEHQEALWYFPPTSAVFRLLKVDAYWVFVEEVRQGDIPWENNTEWKIFHCVRGGDVAWFLDQGLKKEVIEIG